MKWLAVLALCVGVASALTPLDDVPFPHVRSYHIDLPSGCETPVQQTVQWGNSRGALCLCQSSLWALTAMETWTRVDSQLPGVRITAGSSILLADKGVVVVGRSDGLWHCTGVAAEPLAHTRAKPNCTAMQVAWGAVHDSAADGSGGVLVAAETGLFSVALGAKPGVQRVGNDTNVLGVAVHAMSSSLAFGTADRVVLMRKQSDGSMLRRVFYTSKWNVVELKHNTSVGAMVDGNISAMAFDHDGTLWVGSDQCINVLLRDYSWRRLDGFRQGLPYANVTAFSPQTLGPGGVHGTKAGGITARYMWIGTTRGLLRYDYASRKFRCYSSARYIPADVNVTGVLAGPVKDQRDVGAVYVSSQAGFARVAVQQWTLAGKMDHYQTLVYPRHDRDGLVSDVGLKQFGNVSTWYGRCSDNGGEHTSIYVASQALRFAVTKDPSVKAKAWRHVQALQMLHNLTGDTGFFARTFFQWSAGQSCFFGHGRWYNSTTMPGWTFKGDTSSDEVSGHMYAYSLAHDMLAESAEEKAMVLSLIDRTLTWIIKNNFTLVGPTGKPTTWGRWNPFYVNVNKTSHDDRGLQSLEILAWLTAGYRLTNSTLFLSALHELTDADNQYGFNLVNAFTFYPLDIVYFDHRLSYFAQHLFVYSVNAMTPQQVAALPPQLVFHVNRTMERAYSYVRRERNSLFASIYSAARVLYPRTQVGPLPPGAGGFDVPLGDGDLRSDLEDARSTLQQWVLDLIDYPVDNTERQDVQLNPYDPSRIRRVLPHNEIPNFNRWDSNPYAIKGGSGLTEYTPSAPLTAYWHLRYFGFLKAPM